MSDYLSDLVNVQISSTTRTLTRVGFGVGLAAVGRVPPSWGSDVVRTYTSAQALLDDGFATVDPAYEMSSAYFGQSPSPTKIKIGKRASGFSQVLRLTPSAPDTGVVYSLNVGGAAVSVTAASSTLSTLLTSLVNAINAENGADPDAIIATGASSTSAQTISGTALDGVIGRGAITPGRALQLVLSNHADWDATTVTVTGVGLRGETITESFTVPNGGNTTVNGSKIFTKVTSVTVPIQSGSGGTFTLGTRARFTASATGTPSASRVDVSATFANDLVKVYDVSSTLTLLDVTSDAGLETDLSAILAVDHDWYGLMLDEQSSDMIVAAASWVQSRRKLFVAQSADSACADGSVDTDVLSLLKDAGYTHVAACFYPATGASNGWLAAGVLGSRLPVDPGSDTWAFKTLPGVAARDVSSTQHEAVLAKNGNTYETVGGVAIFYPGKVSAGEWADIVRGIDWLVARMRERLFAAQVGSRRIPYTQNGIDLVASLARAQLGEGQRVGFLDAAVAPVVIAPKIGDISSETRATRVLPAVTFSAKVAGAIHAITITGTVTA